MNKKFLLIFIWLIAIGLIAINIIHNPNSFIVNGTIILGWLLFALQLSMNQSEHFYMLIKKWWYLIKNPDCLWNMQVEYGGEFNREIFTKIDTVFYDQSTNHKKIDVSNTRKLYRIGSLSFEISLDEYEGKIRLLVEDLELSFRRSQKIIEAELSTLLENISRSIKEESSDYYLNINFKDLNPYYGFFVRRLNAQDISTFNVKFNIENDRIAIDKKSIEVHTNSLQKLCTFSKEYLTLSPR